MPDLLMRAIVLEALAERKQLTCALCKKILEYMDGQIAITNNPCATAVLGPPSLWMASEQMGTLD